MKKFTILTGIVLTFVIVGMAEELKAQPDLVISEFSLTPREPRQGEPVSVRVGVYNKGDAPSGPFTVEWWPGEDYTAPACKWRVKGVHARGGRIFTCRYKGFPSWYARLTTKVVVDPGGRVAENDESNNEFTQVIRVLRRPRP